MSDFIKILKHGLDSTKTKNKTNAQQYVDRDINLETLALQILKWFKDRKFNTKILKGDDMWLIQAEKEGVVRAATASARTFHVTITGISNNFTLKIDTGKWINNLTALGVMTILSCGCLLPFCGIATAWSSKIKADLNAFITRTMDFMNN